MLHILHSYFPTIENSIPIFNWFMDIIKDFQKKNLSESLKIASKKAIDKLKNYHQFTNGLIYTISTSMFCIF